MNRAALLGMLLASIACSKSEPAPGSKPDLKIETTYEKVAAALDASVPPAVPPSAMTAAPTPPSSHVIVDRQMYEEAGALAPRVVTRTFETKTAVDPDKAILDDAHMRAAKCFDGFIFDRSNRTAKIDVTVIPTGTVTRAEVSSSDTREPQVLACLKSLGESLKFSDRTGPASPDSGTNGGGLRTYAIDVAVVPAH